MSGSQRRSACPDEVTVLVVEDSTAAADQVAAALRADPGIRVVGVALDAASALNAALALRPAVITMNVHMPRVNGFDLSRRIMESCPTPIVIVEGTGASDGSQTLHAAAAGALATVARPQGPDSDGARALVQMVKLMSEVKVVRRWPRPDAHPRATDTKPAPKGERAGAKPRDEPAGEPVRRRRQVQLIAIGASTGGPQVLQAILSALPRQLPVPIVIVQHIAAGFVDGFVNWLADATGYPVHLAANGAIMQPGHAYVAPDGLHLGVRPDCSLHLSGAPPEHGVRPSVSYLFRSLHETVSPNLAAVLLTGMGRDGVDELKRLRDDGALTLVQDEATSVVFGMPGQAIKAGAATHVLSPQGIAGTLAALIEKP